ncbi:MAG: ABC transporter permease [Coriobacteriia bacterium]|nr:ABC transporter permease [Coriobacteriia bacterium]
MQTASLLNGGLFKNLVKRFWPLWLIWLCAWFLTYVAPLYSFIPAVAEPGLDLVNTIDSQISIWNMSSFIVLFNAFLAAIIVTVFLNERLFSAKAATFYGSLPMKRDAVFATSYLAGLVPLLAVEGIVAIILLPLAATSPGIGFDMVGLWLVTAVAFTFILYSFAVLVCQIAGTPAVAVFLYLLVNVLAVCVEVAIRFVVSALVWGVAIVEPQFDWLAPAACLAHHCVWVDTTSAGVNWTVLGLYCLAAVGFVALALWLCRKRGYEHAGDPIAFQPLRPILKYLAGACGALLLAGFTYLMLMATREGAVHLGAAGALLFAVVMVLGAALGVLFAQMVLARSTRVFKDVWKSALVLSCASVLFVGACYFDVLGISTHIPETVEVERALLICDGMQEGEFTSESGIESVRSLHRQALEYRQQVEGLTDADAMAAQDAATSTTAITVIFELKNGDMMRRDYEIPFGYDPETAKVLPGPGSEVIESAGALANSEEGKRSRLAVALDPESGCTYTFTLGLGQDEPEGGEQTVIVSPGQVKSFIEDAFEPDMLEGPAGDSTVLWMWRGTSPTAVNANMYIVDKDGRYLCEYQLDTEKTPHTVAWLKEHYQSLNSAHGELELKPISDFAA